MPKIICEIICSPVGAGVSVSHHVKNAILAMKKIDGIRIMTHPMGTVFEADTLDQVFETVRVAHEAILAGGISRVVTQVRIDDRRDVERKMEDKVEAVSGN